MQNAKCKIFYFPTITAKKLSLREPLNSCQSPLYGFFREFSNWRTETPSYCKFSKNSLIITQLSKIIPKFVIAIAGLHT